MISAFDWLLGFDEPAWLWLLSAIPLLVVVSMRSLAGLDRARRVTALVMRSLVIAALALALARVQFVKRNKNVAVMFVLDRSASIPQDLHEKSQDFIRKAAKEANRDDRIGVIGFDGGSDVDLISSRGGFDIQSFGMGEAPDRTNIAGGLRLAMAAFPQGFGRRAVLVTDGNQNEGELKEEIETARANGVVVDVLPLQYQHENEVLFDRITVPAHANKDTKVPVRMIIKSRRPTKVKVDLYHNDEPVPLSENVFELSGGMKPDPFSVPLELHGGGIHRFRADITPLDEKDDSIPANNRATAFTFVEDQGRVLILTQAGSNDDQVLYEALKREKVDVEMFGVDQFSLDLLKLQQYGVTILSNIAADQFNDEQHKALASYVRDFGGGLIMTGGNEGFGAGGWIGKPVEEVSPVSFEVKHKKIMPRGALGIVMHSCEIAKGMYWGMQVAVAAIQTISTMDYIGIIDLDYKVSGPNWEIPFQPATDKAAIIRKAQNLSNGDMPDFEPMMASMYTGIMALKDASQRHVIIISDGDPAAPLPSTIQKFVAAGITVSTVGIGYGSHVNEPTLRKIAADCKGTFYACRNPSQLPQIFIKEAKVVKRPLIDEHTFQPRLVGLSQVTLGIGANEFPPLGGIVLTTPKADATLPLSRKSGDGDDPVFAHWNYEMGKMAVFTSGFWPKWGTNWGGWEKFGKFWAQTVRWAMRQTGSADFDIVSRVEGTRGHISIEAVNKDASYLNFLEMKGKVLTPGMEQRDLVVRQTGPGQYEADFDIKEHGNYLVNLRYKDPQHDAGMINTGVSVSYSPEFREMNANAALLQEAADRTGGRVLDFTTKVPEIFSRNLPPSVAKHPVWRWIVAWLLIPLFILDVAARRLASAVAMSVYVEIAVLATGCSAMYMAGAHWWGYLGVFVLAEMVGWTIRRRSIRPALAWVTGSVRAQAGDTSQQSLSQLKGVRDKMKTDLQQEGESKASRDAGVALEPAADKSRRFDVGDKQAAQPAGDLTSAVGGADVNEMAADQARRESGVRKPGEGASGDLSSRLKRAKQRAQNEIKDRTDDTQ